MSIIESISGLLEVFDPIKQTGRVTKVAGSVIESSGPFAEVGDLCRIYSRPNAVGRPAEVIGFRGETLVLMPLEEMAEIGPGAAVEKQSTAGAIPVGEGFIGRVINAHGEPIDGKGPLPGSELRALTNLAPHPLKRVPVTEPLATGIRAIDGFLTLGRGQRTGIIAGSGVGKSILLGMIARKAEADVNIIALIGERGREVLEFLDRDLGEEGLRKSAVVVATSDELPLLRRRGALLATTLAEYFRDQGKSVILMMDSLTRVAMAQREIGLAAGEPPTSRGYTPSTFSLLPRLIERAGNSEHGSITGIYTVLVEGDDINDTVGDTARGILDGHIVLSRELAARAHYPAIDILNSASRVMPSVVDGEHLAARNALAELLAIYRRAEDLINIGAYSRGTNPKIDLAIDRIEAINALLKQDMMDYTSFAETRHALRILAQQISQDKGSANEKI